MPNWEYKILTSGALGFASPQLLEQHLNQLGKEEWEIIHFQTRPDNPLAFSGLARRPVMRDWTAEPAAAPTPGLKSSAVPEPPEDRIVSAPSASELRAEAEERRESLLAREESLRPLGDAAASDDDDGDDLDSLEEEELPTFFEAIRPHMRRNLKGPGMAVSVEYLAKKFGQTEANLTEALKECGFSVPASPKDESVQLEYDGDLYWLNLNSRRQLWINTREKPRAAFRVVAGTKVVAEPAPADTGGDQPAGDEPSPRPSSGQPEVSEPGTAPAAEPLPAGAGLLDRLRPMMRRNRRDSGLSGSISYLARALKSGPAALEAAFAASGLAVPPDARSQPAPVGIGAFVYWLNRDKSGQIWINAREQGRDEAPGAEPGHRGEAAVPAAPQAELPLAPVAGEAGADAPVGATPKASPLAAVRLLLKETTRGGVAAELNNLAKQLHKSPEELEAALVGAGLKVPVKPREKPVFAEHAGEIFWLNRNSRGELWVNAKASKYAAAPSGAEDATDGSAGADKAHRNRSRRPRRKSGEESGEGTSVPAPA